MEISQGTPAIPGAGRDKRINSTKQACCYRNSGPTMQKGAVNIDCSPPLFVQLPSEKDEGLFLLAGLGALRLEIFIVFNRAQYRFILALFDLFHFGTYFFFLDFQDLSTKERCR